MSSSCGRYNAFPPRHNFATARERRVLEYDYDRPTYPLTHRASWIVGEHSPRHLSHAQRVLYLLLA
jgi:hypothetical protein